MSIGTFYGKPIEDLDRDGLLDVIRHLMEQNQRHTTPEAIRANALGMVEMMKRGERRASA